MKLKTEILTGVLVFLSASSISLPTSTAPPGTSTPPPSPRSGPHAWKEEATAVNLVKNYNDEATNSTFFSSMPLRNRYSPASTAAESPPLLGSLINREEILRTHEINSDFQTDHLSEATEFPRSTNSFSDNLSQGTTENSYIERVSPDGVPEASKNFKSYLMLADSSTTKKVSDLIEAPSSTTTTTKSMAENHFSTDSLNFSSPRILHSFEAERSPSTSTTSMLNVTTESSTEITGGRREDASDFPSSINSSQDATIIHNTNATVAFSSDQLQFSATERAGDEMLLETYNTTSSSLSSEIPITQLNADHPNEFRRHEMDSSPKNDSKSDLALATPRNTTNHVKETPPENFQAVASNVSEHNAKDFVNMSVVPTVPTTPVLFPRLKINESHKRSVPSYSNLPGKIDPRYYEADERQPEIAETYDFRPILDRTEVHRGDPQRDQAPFMINHKPGQEEGEGHLNVDEESINSTHNEKNIGNFEHRSQEEPSISRRIDSLGGKDNSISVYSNFEAPVTNSVVKPPHFTTEYSAISSIPRDNLPHVSLPVIPNDHDGLNDILVQGHSHLSEDSIPLFEVDENTNFSYSLRDLNISNAQETPDPIQFDHMNSTEAPTKFPDSKFNVTKNSDTFFETPLGTMTRQDTKMMLYLLFFVCGILLLGMVVLLSYWIKAKLEVRRLDMEMRRACLQGLDHRYVGRGD